MKPFKIQDLEVLLTTIVTSTRFLLSNLISSPMIFPCPLCCLSACFYWFFLPKEPLRPSVIAIMKPAVVDELPTSLRFKTLCLLEERPRSASICGKGAKIFSFHGINGCTYRKIAQTNAALFVFSKNNNLSFYSSQG